MHLKEIHSKQIHIWKQFLQLLWFRRRVGCQSECLYKSKGRPDEGTWEEQGCHGKIYENDEQNEKTQENEEEQSRNENDGQNEKTYETEKEEQSKNDNEEENEKSWILGI